MNIGEWALVAIAAGFWVPYLLTPLAVWWYIRRDGDELSDALSPFDHGRVAASAEELAHRKRRVDAARAGYVGDGLHVVPDVSDGEREAAIADWSRFSSWYLEHLKSCDSCAQVSAPACEAAYSQLPGLQRHAAP